MFATFKKLGLLAVVFAFVFTIVAVALPTGVAEAKDAKGIVRADGATWARTNFQSVVVVYNKKKATVTVTQLLATAVGAKLDLGNGVVLTRVATSTADKRNNFTATVNGKATVVGLSVLPVGRYGNVVRVTK